MIKLEDRYFASNFKNLFYLDTKIHFTNYIPTQKKKLFYSINF